MIMWRNYLKVALRNLYRYKGFSLINILGLAIGLTGCLLIGLFVWDEQQYDQFVKDGDNIYRIYSKNSVDNSKTIAVTPPAFATYLKDNYPEVEQTTRLLMWNGKALMEHEDERAYENKGFIADSNFFSVFPLKFIKGDPNTALSEPMSVVITEDLAHKYFGNSDP